MKLFEKLLGDRLRKLIKVDGRQFGFCPKRSTSNAIFERKKKLYHVFVNLERDSTECQGKQLKGH